MARCAAFPTPLQVAHPATDGFQKQLRNYLNPEPRRWFGTVRQKAFARTSGRLRLTLS